MKCKEFIELLKTGKQPIVKLTDTLWDDSWGQSGMIAKVLRFKYDCMPNSYEIMFDFGIAPEHNLALQDHNYYIYKNGVDTKKLGTEFEAGLRKEGDLIEEIYFDEDQDMPFIINEDEHSPLGRYLKYMVLVEKFELTYLQWLESKIEPENDPSDCDSHGHVIR